MTVELSLLISCVSVAFALFFGFATYKRNSRMDTDKDAKALATMLVKLEHISGGVSEIKVEITDLKTDDRETRERLIIVEQSANAAHNRLDKIEGKVSI